MSDNSSITREGEKALERVRHVKRGTEYEVLGEAEAQVATGHRDINDMTYTDIPADPDSVRALAPELWADLDKEIAEGINKWMEDDGYEGLDSPSDISQGIADCCVAAILTRYRSFVPAALGTEAEGQNQSQNTRGKP